MTRLGVVVALGALWVVVLGLAWLLGCGAAAGRHLAAVNSGTRAASDPGHGCAVPPGCFAYQPSCEPTACYCPRVCGGVFTFPPWSRGGTAGCRCPV